MHLYNVVPNDIQNPILPSNIHAVCMMTHLNIENIVLVLDLCKYPLYRQKDHHNQFQYWNDQMVQVLANNIETATDLKVVVDRY